MFIDQIKSGLRVQIQQPGDGPNDGYMCKVEVALPEAKEILVHAPVSRGRLVDLPKGVRYSLRLLTDNAIFKYNAAMLGYTDVDGFDVVKFHIIDGGEKVQRREAFRFNCALPVTYSIIFSSGEQSDWEEGLVRDLSAGGVKMYSQKKLQLQDLLNISLQLGEDLVVAFGDVRTKRELGKDSKFAYQYGVRFAMMPESDKERIIRYMYKEQREQLKKARPRA